MESQIILGIDPGSRCTGYGLIRVIQNQSTCLAFGEIRTNGTQLQNRLQQINDALNQIIQTHQPHEAAIEQVFTFHNHQSALKLGQARGAALVALTQAALPVSEYSARQVKKAVVGYGGASKTQIQQMVTLLLKLKTPPPADAADALAIALCHANSRRLNTQLTGVAR